jgi:hypothetical protein
VKTQVGKLIKRVAKNSTIDDKRAEVTFKSEYENLPQANEKVMMAKVNGKWMVVGYLVQ